jgi:mannose/cellobiose epimerase-like protein (N-acyl-D-glucosamine 2-epimerase family)/anti-anti-sigma regulatory factor
MDKMHFTFSDMIAGYINQYEWEKRDFFTMKTSDGREFEVKIGDFCYAELMRNLGQGFTDCTSQMRDMLAPGRYLFAYGIFYNEGGSWNFEAKHLVFSGRTEGEFVFEKQDWWIHQIENLNRFYLKAQFGDGEIDYRNYRTQLTISGERTGNYRQECDTISRLVYGFASAYNLTGDERALEAAEAGTKYLREHFRCLDKSDKTAYWYHAIDVNGAKERKVFASENGEDYDAIPAYEQIYALAGPTQTFRINGDPNISTDIQMTMNMFQKYYLDRKNGGYWSHIDPITFDGRAESLAHNRARKNWNSIGDHAPAYLINAVLATGNPEWAQMLEYCGDLITQRFPDYENSPFVNEKFHENWEHDQTWGWQQNRGVVGHNLKIAWNLMRIHSMNDKKEYVELAERIAALMPEHGGDRQRGGWYDVVSRTLNKGEDFHRYAWHDRKAWWQQEQGILAYLILAGTLGKPEYLKLARESSAFYNAWFLDHESGGIYFNVLANGIPYLLGTERNKGSHSMSGYHSFELCYLASVYSNLLITKQPMDFYFKPMAGASRVLNVAPDMLPKGSIRIERVWIDDKEHRDFDAESLRVHLPASTQRLKVKVQIAPTSGVTHFAINWSGDTMVLSGDLDAQAVYGFMSELATAVGRNPDALTIDASKLQSMSKPAARALLLEKQKMNLEADLTIIGANKELRELLDDDEFSEEITLK